MKKLRMAMVVLGLVLLVVLGGFLAYVLPHHEVVHVNGSDVKRLDAGGQPVDATHIVTATRDVFLINTADVSTNEVRVFRNEDTRWGFPWYLKFDSAEVQARAQMLARDSNQRALVTYYGWRIAMLGLYPNAVDVQPWSEDAGPFPVFNTVLLALVIGLLALVWWKLRQMRRKTPGQE